MNGVIGGLFKLFELTDVESLLARLICFKDSSALEARVRHDSIVYPTRRIAGRLLLDFAARFIVA